MRDGVELFTAVYAPNEPGDATYPILMFRTPYSVRPYGADRYRDSLGPTPDFAREKFIFVYQDVRGRYMSQGHFVNMRPHRARKRGPQDVDESTDTYDTIEWLLANVPRHNGKVGQWGISYPGFYTAAGMIDSHPALKAASPQAPIADWFWDDMHHHGAFVLPLAFTFFSSFGQPRPEPTTERAERIDLDTVDGYRFYLELGPLQNVNERYFKGEIDFWNQFIAHPNYDDFWQSRNLLPHLKNVKAAVMVVGGWFDAEDLYGPLKIYRAVERNNPGTFNMLVMGPWRHGGWARSDGRTLGTADFGFPTSAYYREHLILPFFKHFLKGEGELSLPEAVVFETGANRWRSFDAWPPENLRQAYLYPRAGGELAFDPPAGDGAEAFDEYVSDPHKPVPYTMNVTTRWEARYMTEDQRFAAWRPDVLVYEGPVLEDDVTLAGPLEAELWVSTSASDADWVVKLIDVHPGELPELEDQDSDEVDPARRALGGQQMLVRGEVIRGRFRDSYEHPKPFTPGEITRVRFELQDVLHTFKRGHRIMLHVQSTWFPLIDRNPQTYVPNVFKAEASDFVKATHRLYRSPAHPSRLKVGILE
ncbi:MAG: CocE/NonD family hydrolase [Acidobacteria bacterium]|nr:MAG: CocE/NonD family hydrolase [Acidobacteriota bacterium]